MQLLPNRWQTYIGILVESTLTKNQRVFNIYVPEFLPTKTGDVALDNGSFGIELLNTLTNATETSEITLSATIEAEYFGAVSTSMDVPTMYRGMQVLVLNYGNNDKWYWIPLERDDSYKTFEHIRAHCADVAQTNKTASTKDDIEGRQQGLTDDNTYYMEIDTKYNKHIMLSTAASDGEEWRYFFKIDAELHTVELWDNCVSGDQPNNTIKLESKPDDKTLGRITLQNAAGNTIMMSGEDTIVNIPRNLIINVGGDTMITKAGNSIESIGMDFARTIAGNESTTTKGMVDHKVVGVYTEVNGAARNVTVVGAHIESQSVRTTTAVSSTWTTGTWNLTASVGNFAIAAVSWVTTTCVINVANALSVTCKSLAANAKELAGTVVTLMRGGHH